ncbi:uncharacterized protein LOC113359925 [Papaver somniferum]|uniref:uncharacterized protein LOC113359925 n=1 Tax=Papaver somniferum TaxID=3469 RepID=UPI000E70353A|nr:uncharacterized protein LOC113359925 [Papaver somniferum]
MVRVVYHDADKAKPMIIDEWVYVFDKVGREFMGGVKSVTIVVDKYKMATGHKIIILKNDKTRFTAKCAENDCGWRIHFGPVNGDISRFVLKDSNIIHRLFMEITYSCLSPAGTTKLVKHLIADNIQGDPSIKPNQIISLFKKTYGSNIKYHHARRGKEDVFEEQFGDDEKSYSDLTWYVQAIKKNNPDSYVKFEVDHATRRFQRIFICFGACKHSYRYLRPMIYLDATFLTGRYKGAFMAATCINGNNEFYPFVFSLISAENKDNWFWFLENLKQVVDGRQIVFLSDRGEGILQGIPKKFLIHITSIDFTTSSAISPLDQVMRIQSPLLICFTKLLTLTQQRTLKKFCGACMQLDVDMLLTISGLFQRRNGQMHFFLYADIVLTLQLFPSPSTTGFLISKSFLLLLFSMRCDTILVHVLSMILQLLKVMKKNSERKIEGLENFNTRLTPIYEALIKENIDIGRTWIVTQSMERMYEVASPRSHTVDLLQKTCTCHRWKVNGFPCAHACAAIQATREDIYSFVEPYFTTKWYNRTYQEIILPIPNHDKPQAYDPNDRVIVPILVSPPGRRRTQRIKNAWEKQKRHVMCTKCFTLGHHNIATSPMI